MLYNFPLKTFTSQSKSTAGFTLIEVLVVVIMIGILSAIAAPSWVTFLNRQRLSKANDTVLSALQSAQQQAKKRKVSYSVSIRTDNNIPQIAIHPTSTPSNWQNLGANLEVKANKILLGTNLAGNNTTSNTFAYAAAFNSSAPQTITFDYTGALKLPVKTGNDGLTAVQDAKIGTKGLIIAVAVPQPGNPTRASDMKRCIIVRTLLGSMKIGKNSECE